MPNSLGNDELGGSMNPSQRMVQGKKPRGHSSSERLESAGPSEGVGILRRSSSRLLLPHSHAHVQWRTIAEEFAALLVPDFVDIVFKVRGKPEFLSAHRTLVAAAWPILREELSRFQHTPSRDFRMSGLAWLADNTDGFSSPGEQAAREASLSLAPQGVPGTSAFYDAQSGVLDVSGRMWGSGPIMAALLNHLYSRPVVTTERELPILRVAALNLGFSELARCCDDIRPIARVQSPDLESVLRSSQEAASTPLKIDRTGVSPGIASVGSGSSTRAESLKSMSGSLPLPAMAERRLSPLEPNAGGADCTQPAVQMTSRGVASADTGEVRAFLMNKPQRSFNAEKARSTTTNTATVAGTSDSRSASSSATATESGGVRRVLSEIKRSMAESSRIIADQTFQQIYEMVPGERGILGEGINGPVRMAKHRKTGREVAVKRISCLNLSEQRRQMLVSEVRIFLQVSHRNIVQLLEVYESEVDQAVLLVMELCTGRELFERLAERRWYSEFDAARVTRQMLDAVSYLHSQNICHRDLKLENWLYENESSEAKLKLCDFGFGQIVEPQVQLTATLGSLFYVAPEVLEGSYGLPCDMWSVGVIVYMLLSGVPPFDAKTDADVISKIKLGRFVTTSKRWEGISETAKHFVRSLLRKDPYERLAAAEAAQHAWLKMECQPKTSWPKGTPDAELELPIDRSVIRDMWKFAQNNAITRAALGLLGKLHNSSVNGEEDVVLLDQKLRSYDVQNTGKISAETFIQVLKESLHLQISTAEEKQFFERIAGNLPGSEDVSGDNYKSRRRREVNYREFIELTKARRMANNTAAIREAFRAFDEKGDGYIKEDDMHSLLGHEFKTTIDNYVDMNGKDVIDYVRFANIVSKEMALKDDQDLSREQSRPSLEQAPVTTDAKQGEPEVVTPSVASAKPGLALSEPSVTERDSMSRPANSPTSVSSSGRRLSGIGSDGDEQREQVSAAAVAAAAASEPSPSTVTADEAPKGATVSGETSPTSHRQKAQHSVRHENDDDRDAQSEEEQEDCDADAQSDEEQLVNVKATPHPEHGEDLSAGQEDKQKNLAPTKESAAAGRFAASFSLSLAGSSEYDDSWSGVNRVLSMPSDVYHIKQLAGFHARTLRPFYAARPVSNVVMGLIRGTSLYAKQSVIANLATIIHTTCGWFFIMPNPKYHTEVDSRKGLLSKETGKFRFVAWWIHPRFVPQLRQWFERCTCDSLEQARQLRRDQLAAGEAPPVLQPPPPTEATRGVSAGGGTAPPVTTAAVATISSLTAPLQSTGGGSTSAEVDAAIAEAVKASILGDEGSPGDFRFSDVPKPENYLHTYRDLHSKDHVSMLLQLRDGTHRFLRSLFDENFMAHAQISAGFHYPVRTQYATLHMQVRVNSGSVCREDGRGIEVNTLIEQFKRDRQVFERDAETLRYQVTENVKVSLLAAAQEYEASTGDQTCRQITPFSYELGAAAMPTIHDEDDEDDEEGSERKEVAAEGTPDMAPFSPPSAGTTSADAIEAMNADSDAARQLASQPVELVKEPTAGEQNEIASYLVNLQPSHNSAFYEVVYRQRETCAELFGPDPTYLYPIHISVSGFFEAPGRVISALVAGMKELLIRELVKDSNVEVRKVICTSTKYVLFDMQAPAISSFSQSLNTWACQELGVQIRPKAVNHISLACNREEAVREKIRLIYEPSLAEPEGERVATAVKSATFDLVLSRLLQRSSFENYEQEGPHKFNEVARIPVRRPKSK